MDIDFGISVVNAAGAKEVFYLPSEFDELQEFINGEDYKIDSYTSILDCNTEEMFKNKDINEINDIVTRIENLSEYDYYGFCAFIESDYTIEESFNKTEEGDFAVYNDCMDMSDVAYDCIEEGLFGNIEEHLKNFIDFDKLGNAMEVNGNFVQVEDNVIVEIY